MAPDFPRLFSPFGESLGHSWTAAFLYYLPSALIIFFLFHWLIKMPVISLAPRPIQPWLIKLSVESDVLPFRRWLAIAASAFVGIATHLCWDSFTHDDGWA